MFSLDDTIAAITTPLGVGGVGIIKISGSQALLIIERLFKPFHASTSLTPRYLHFGHIIQPDTSEAVDEVLVVYMPGPHSYTCQDIVEIQAHGGIVSIQAILQLVLSHGARIAEPGEMTLRAFVNGRIDLTQAEAVLDIIEAKTEAGLRLATQQLGGSVSSQVSQVRQLLVNTLAYLEATIDFVDEDIPLDDIIPNLRNALSDIETLIKTADQGIIYRQGIRTAIVGKPNVGKSSLLNALLRGERAIVTDIPGTTRDTLEETANIGGIPIVLVDTAGIRTEPSDAVEQIGIERSQAALVQADLALLVIDQSQPLTNADWEIEKLVRDKPSLLIRNKADLPNMSAIPEAFLADTPHVQLSALTGQGLERLETEIVAQVTGNRVVTTDTAIVNNPRHKALLVQAAAHTQSAIEAQQASLSSDLISIDVREAVDALGEITGETATEDLLNAIFSKFCIGK